MVVGIRRRSGPGPGGHAAALADWGAVVTAIPAVTYAESSRLSIDSRKPAHVATRAAYRM